MSRAIWLVCLAGVLALSVVVGVAAGAPGEADGAPTTRPAPHAAEGVTTTDVPEPATLILLAIGAFLIWPRRRRA